MEQVQQERDQGQGEAPDIAPAMRTAGYGNPARPLVDSKTEIEILRRQVANIDNELQAIRDRLAKISEKH